MKHFATLSEFTNHAGQELGTTDWLVVTQAMIDKFAEATGDHQWLHTDPERAAQASPYATTIAHGFLTLALAPKFLNELYAVNSIKMAVNYGANRIRFTNAVPADSKIRMKAWLQHVELHNQPADGQEELAGAIRAFIECVFEVEGQHKPACVAELVILFAE